MGLKQNKLAYAASNDGYVSVGDTFSDESSFYGGEDSKAQLEKRLAAFDPQEYWDIAQWNIQCIAARSINQTHPRGIKKRPESIEGAKPSTGSPQVEYNPLRKDTSGKASKPPAQRPYNPYEGDRMAKQLSEPLDDFLSRLPPSKSGVALGGPWIWIADPHSAWRPTDEDVAGFKQYGSRVLDEYRARKSHMETQYPKRAQSGISRMLKPERDALEVRIFDLAKQHRVIGGKWMLFLSPDEVDSVWSVTAKAVNDGKLGPTAKVATNDDDPNNRYQLLCIYTADFSDLKDVTRVLNRMRELGLLKAVGEKAQVFYYKCDAYTYLDIVSGNEFKLKASMYNSRDLMSDQST